MGWLGRLEEILGGSVKREGPTTKIKNLTSKKKFLRARGARPP